MPLAELGGLSQLRRRGRDDKATLLNRVERFQDDLRGAEKAVAGGETHIGERRKEFASEVAWEVQNGWRTERLDVVEAELADIRGDHPTPDDSLLSREEHPNALVRRRSNERPSYEPRTTGWERRLADIAAPPVPARDADLDLGL